MFPVAGTFSAGRSRWAVGYAGGGDSQVVHRGQVGTAAADAKGLVLAGSQMDDPAGAGFGQPSRNTWYGTVAAAARLPIWANGVGICCPPAAVMDRSVTSWLRNASDVRPGS